MTDFDDAYREHLTSVFRYAVKCVGRREIAEEITAEAFVALYNTFDRIDPGLLPGWLFTVVRNRATDFWRRSALERKYSAGLDPEPKAETSSSIQEWLDAAPALKPVHRACLILRYVHGLERTAIAGRLGLSEIQVKGYLQYAHQLLRKELSEKQ
jgi:RNA polymerase sigma-70 factor (ECF subfamily)